MLTWLLATILVVIGIHRLWRSSRWNHIPGHKSYTSLPLLGHIYLFGDKPLECLDENQKKFGNIFRLDIGNFPTVWLCDYDDITAAFKQDNFSDRTFQQLPLLVCSSTHYHRFLSCLYHTFFLFFYY